MGMQKVLNKLDGGEEDNEITFATKDLANYWCQTYSDVIAQIKVKFQE